MPMTPDEVVRYLKTIPNHRLENKLQYNALALAVTLLQDYQKLLKKEGVPHNVLNAKEHQREALIVAQAGKAGMITVATNMAGRGTDIVLGGNVKHQSDAIRADESLSDSEKEARITDLEQGWEAENKRV